MLPMLERILLALEGLESGDYATGSRGFGRGVAFACKAIRKAISNEEAVKHPLGGCSGVKEFCTHY